MEPQTSMPRRHLPLLDTDNRGFWQSGADGSLLITRCQQCSLFIFPHAPICRRCLSRELKPEPVSGIGTVGTFTINRHPWEAGLESPFVIAIVTLTEQAGLNILSNIVNCLPEEVSIGMPVRMTFEKVEDVWLPVFEPSPRSN